MKKIYYLETCESCRNILKKFDFSAFEKQEIKSQSITPEQLDELKEMAGSYEALFSKRARKYKELGLKDKNLNESEIRDLILNEYTFLKRPVIIDHQKIFIGSDKKNLEELSNHSL